MDFLILLIIIFIIIIFVFIIKSPKFRGSFGEIKVKFIIGKTIGNEQYVINDIIIASGKSTSQIDHIVINKHGVFVIETKNYSGYIYGSEQQREWIQILANGKVKNKLYNPVRQNAKHVYDVKKIIGDLPIFSVVVFAKNNTHYINSKNVIPLSSLKDTLNYGENILSIEQMKTAYETLLMSRSKLTLEEHIEKIKEKQRNLKRGICPRCGGILILKNGNLGNVWICSNYPKCKFIKKDEL